MNPAFTVRGADHGRIDHYARATFALQVLVCPRCGGPRRILGVVTEPHAVRRLLAALRLAAEPPPDHATPAA